MDSVDLALRQGCATATARGSPQHPGGACHALQCVAAAALHCAAAAPPSPFASEPAVQRVELRKSYSTLPSACPPSWPATRTRPWGARMASWVASLRARRVADLLCPPPLWKPSRNRGSQRGATRRGHPCLPAAVPLSAPAVATAAKAAEASAARESSPRALGHARLSPEGKPRQCREASEAAVQETASLWEDNPVRSCAREHAPSPTRSPYSTMSPFG